MQRPVKAKSPHFLIVGAAKSSTTSIFHYLNQHPQIYIPELKECRFFSQLPNNQKGLGAEVFPNHGIRDQEKYFGLYHGQAQKICGDISNDYLYYYTRSISNIKEFLGDGVKIVIILRNPVDRAYSNFLHHYREGWEVDSFEEALALEENRRRQNWAWPYHYKRVGLYFKQVNAYKCNFKKLRIYLFEEFTNNIHGVLKDIFSFLGVDTDFRPQVKRRYNVSGFPRIKLIHNIITGKSLLNTLTKPVCHTIPQSIRSKYKQKIKSANIKKMPMKKSTRHFLSQYYKDDIIKLNTILDCDVLNWISSI